MNIALCIIAGIVVCLHAYAALIQMRRDQNKINGVLMLIGAIIAMTGIVLSLANNAVDWLIALAGFAFIAYAAIQNGKRNQNFHIQHHIVRIAVFAVLTIGLACL